MAGVVDEQTTGAAQKRRRRECREGAVVSRSGDKTVRVRYDYIVRHPKYGKYYKRSTTLHVHDEKNEGKVGDIVEVMACRRISKAKCWRLTRIIGSNE